MSNKDEVEIEVVIKREKDQALLVDAGLDFNVWLPKSQIKEYSQFPFTAGDSLSIIIPEWLAISKGLI